MKRFHSLALLLGASFFAARSAPAQTGEFTARLLGAGTVVNDMNESGAVVGWTVAGGLVQAYVASPSGYGLLPPPDGYASAWAQGINDAGVVVGSAAILGFPEFGQAVAWVPDGQGGYTTQFLGQLPGHTQSVAYDVNNRGDIVGWSITPGFQGGPTVWFNSPSGVLDVSALGAPSSPKQVNDQGVIVGISGGLFDLDTLQASPLPPLPASWTIFQGWAINDLGELAGTAFHGGVARSAAIWTQAGGWQSISPQFSLSAPVQAFDINDSRDCYAEVPAAAARFEGLGTTTLASLLVPAQQGGWVFFNNQGGAVNDAGQIAAIGTEVASGQSGVVLLTPLPDGPRSYCTGKVSSLGCTPFLTTAGQASASSTAAFQIAANDLVPGEAGFLLYGFRKANLDFHGGKLCIKAPIARLLPPKVASAVLPPPCSGRIQRDFNAVIQSGADGLLTVGQSVCAQLLQRDPTEPMGFGDSLTDAVEFTVAP